MSVVAMVARLSYCWALITCFMNTANLWFVLVCTWISD